jgi:hypothetical protein
MLDLLFLSILWTWLLQLNRLILTIESTSEYPRNCINSLLYRFLQFHQNFLLKTFLSKAMFISYIHKQTSWVVTKISHLIVAINLFKATDFWCLVTKHSVYVPSSAVSAASVVWFGLWYTRSRVWTRPKPDFSGEKIHSMPSFGGEVKPSVPCRRFAACKRSLRFTWKSESQAKLTGHFSPNSVLH